MKYTVDLEVINFDVQITDVDLTSLSGLLTSLLGTLLWFNIIVHHHKYNVRDKFCLSEILFKVFFLSSLQYLGKDVKHSSFIKKMYKKGSGMIGYETTFH